MSDKKVLIETSARHLHISDEHLAILFGEGYQLTPKKDLSQPGQYACEERVIVRGPKGEFNMSILGPTRKATQIEISLTDARSMGVTVPVRESGDIGGSTGCLLVGPNGEVEIAEGLIAAKRHIHMTPEDAAEYGIGDKDIIGIKYNEGGRAVLYMDTVARVSDSYATAVHLDTDEANAAGIAGPVYGEIVIL